MKSNQEIINSLNKLSLINVKVESEDDPRVKQVVSFYEKYPQYAELEANGVFFVLSSIRTKKKPVKVYRFINGDILFVGDIITTTNAPLAGIGDGVPLPQNFNWNNIEGTGKEILTFIEEITWTF